MKRTEPRSIASILDEALDLTGMTADFNEHKLCSLWPEVVGDTINRMTTRRYVDHGVLHVYLTSAALKNELSFNRAALITLLNKAVGTNVITDIKFH